MVPGTAASLIGFLLFVAPGLLFDILAERSRPPLPGSTFREISRVALVSVVCTGLAAGVLAIVRAAQSDLVFDPSAWLRDGDNYLDKHFALIAGTIGAEVAVAFGIALAIYWIFIGRHPRATRNDPLPVLWSIVGGRGSVPDSRKGARLFALARTAEGSVYQGFVVGVDMDPERDQAMLGLQPPIRFQRAGQPPGEMPEYWDRLALPLADIHELWLQWIRQDTPRRSG